MFCPSAPSHSSGEGRHPSGTVPIRPASKSSNACTNSAREFMTKGPAQATGSLDRTPAEDERLELGTAAVLGRVGGDHEQIAIAENGQLACVERSALLSDHGRARRGSTRAR